MRIGALGPITPCTPITNTTQQYAFGPGYINWNGGDFPDANTRLAYVRADAARGSDTLTVDSLAKISVGQVRVCAGVDRSLQLGAALTR